LRYQVIFRKEARDEAVQAAAYIAHQGYPETALRWYEGLVDAIDSLATMPERCGYANENDRFAIELRQLLYKPYRIIFTIRDATVHVLHVRHTAMDDLGTL
jgi:plasmid stabilization system protein ParE